MDEPILKPGIASCKKKVNKKGQVIPVDKKALTQAIYLETVEMFGSKWHKFEDSRGWIWTQEDLENKK